VTGTETPEEPSARSRLLAVLVADLFPWTIVQTGDGASLVSAFGLVNTGPFGLTTAYDYSFVHTAGLPARLQAWALGIILQAWARSSATGGRLDRKDPRRTGGLLLFPGVGPARVATGTDGCTSERAGRPSSSRSARS